MINNLNRFFARWKNDPVVQIARDASTTKYSRSFVIPSIWAAVIIGTGWLFADGKANGVSLHVMDVVSSLGCFSVFLIAKIVEKFRPVSGIRLWVVSGLVATAISPISLWIRDGYVEQSYLETVPTGFLAYPMLSAVIGVIIANRLNLQEESKLLNRQNADLLRKAEMLDEDAATVESELRSEIQSRLEDALATESLTAGHVDAAQTSIAKLREVINLVIRPVAHEIDQMDTRESISRIQSSETHELVPVTRVKQKLPYVPISDLISAPFFVLGSLVFISPASFFVYGKLGVLSALLIVTLEMVALNLFKSRFGHKQYPAGIAIALISVLIMVIGYGFNPLTHLMQPGTDTSVAIPLGFWFVGTGLSIYLLLIARKQASIAALAEVNVQNERLVALLRQKVWVKQRQLARIVHGQVQSRFIASALRLSSAKVVDQELLESVWSEVRAAVDSLTETSDNEVGLVELLTDIAEAWDGVCAIEYSVTRELIDLIDAQPYARTCIQELITEAVSNGAKHIQAIRAYISISKVSETSLEVIVRCAGDTSQLKSVQPGYGSKTLDDITTHWKLDITKTGSTLRAEVPIK